MTEQFSLRQPSVEADARDMAASRALAFRPAPSRGRSETATSRNAAVRPALFEPRSGEFAGLPRLRDERLARAEQKARAGAAGGGRRGRPMSANDSAGVCWSIPVRAVCSNCKATLHKRIQFRSARPLVLRYSVLASMGGGAPARTGSEIARFRLLKSRGTLSSRLFFIRPRQKRYSWQSQ